MKREFPKVTKASQRGEQGVNIVTQIVSNDLGCLFRRTHNENDFGIDGYIDFVSSEGYVTGRCLAVQIKCGTSFFKQTITEGITYYGEAKHLNYLANHPVPTIIVICDPATRRCYWEKFDLSLTEPTPTGWKMTIPIEQGFSSLSYKRLSCLAGIEKDYIQELEDCWKMNQLLIDSGVIVYAISKEEILEKNFQPLIRFFERLQVMPKLTKEVQGRVIILVSGYDEDPRELYQISKVRKWFQEIEPLIKYWFFFLSVETSMSGINLLAYLLCKLRFPSKDKSKNMRRGIIAVEMDAESLIEFALRNFVWLNEMTEKLNMSLEENKRISFEIWDVLLRSLMDSETVERKMAQIRAQYR